MAKKRKIALVTGSRAEFGLLQPVARAIDNHKHLDLHCIVAGMHLVTGTWQDVKDAEIKIAARVPMQTKNKTGRAADTQALARGISTFGKTFEKLTPDIVVVLGDRIEVFAAAAAANISGHRIAHIHSGDRAAGVCDEAIRHATAKLAHIHFSATAQSRNRLIGMGEDKKWIFNFGSPAADNLKNVQSDFDSPQVIVLQHPVGQSAQQEKTWFNQTLRATRNYDRLVMAPNHDPGCLGIRQALRASKIKFVDHLPRDQWLRLLAGAKVIVGNSSAALIEAAVLKTPAVNIGPRQAGREKPANVIDCNYGEKPVTSAIKKALKLNLSRMRHPYGTGRTGQLIADHLATIALDKIPIHKHNSY